MNKEEYLKKINELDEKHDFVKRRLANKYLRENAGYSVGDIVGEII